MILHYFKKNENKDRDIAINIFRDTIKSSKFIASSFIVKKKLTFNHSFEIISILIFCIFYASKYNKKYQLKYINQELMNIFIKDLDVSLRELGVGDMSIGRHVKKYIKKFYYRISILEKIFLSNDLDKFIDYLYTYSIIDIDKIDQNSSIFFDNLNTLILRIKKRHNYFEIYKGLFN